MSHILTPVPLSLLLLTVSLRSVQRFYTYLQTSVIGARRYNNHMQICQSANVLVSSHHGYISARSRTPTAVASRRRHRRFRNSASPPPPPLFHRRATSARCVHCMKLLQVVRLYLPSLLQSPEFQINYRGLCSQMTLAP